MVLRQRSVCLPNLQWETVSISISHRKKNNGRIDLSVNELFGCHQHCIGCRKVLDQTESQALKD